MLKFQERLCTTLGYVVAARQRLESRAGIHRAKGPGAGQSRKIRRPGGSDKFDSDVEAPGACSLCPLRPATGGRARAGQVLPDH